MAARPAQFFIITAILISGVIIAVSTITPTYYISQPDQTLRIGLLTDSIDGLTESALASIEIDDKGQKAEKTREKFEDQITDTISRLRYNDVTLVLNGFSLVGNISGKIDVTQMPGSPPIFEDMPANVNVEVDFTISSPSFRLNYISFFNTSVSVAGTGASGGLLLIENIDGQQFINQLILPLFFTVNGEPYDNALFAIGKKKDSDTNVTIINVEGRGSGIYILKIEFSVDEDAGGETEQFNLEIYTARGARTDIVIDTFDD